MLHAAAAGTSLVVACSIGLYLLFASPSDTSLRVAIAYGVVGLVGFLGQMVVGMQARLVPLLAWYRALTAARLRRNNAGGFGAVIPVATGGGHYGYG